MTKRQTDFSLALGILVGFLVLSALLSPYALEAYATVVWIPFVSLGIFTLAHHAVMKQSARTWGDRKYTKLSIVLIPTLLLPIEMYSVTLSTQLYEVDFGTTLRRLAFFGLEEWPPFRVVINTLLPALVWWGGFALFGNKERAASYSDKAYDGVIDPGQIDLYQKAFNDLLTRTDLEAWTRFGQGKKPEKAKLDKEEKFMFEVFDEADRAGLSTFPLQIMTFQYIMADEREREFVKTDWVRRILSRKDEDFFPDAISTKSLLAKIYHSE